MKDKEERENKLKTKNRIGAKVGKGKEEKWKLLRSRGQQEQVLLRELEGK